MSPWLLAFVFAFIFFDTVFIKKQDPALYRECVRSDSWPVVVYGVLVLVLFLLSRRWEDLPVYGFLFILPVYLLKRYGFFKRLDPVRRDPQVLGLRLSLTLDAFNMALIWFAVMSVLALGLEFFLSLYPQMQSELGEVVFISGLSPIFLLWFIKRAIRKYRDISLREVLGLKRQDLSLWRLIGIPVLSGVGVAVLSSVMIHSRETQPTTPLTQMVESTTSPWVFLALLVVAVLMAPFLEEIIFRGYLYYLIEKIKGKKFAVILIALLFALLHVEQYWGDWAAITMVAILGVLLTLLRMWTRSSIPGVIMHYVYNGSMTIFSVLVFMTSYPSYYEFQAKFPELTFQEKETLLQKSMEQFPGLAGPYNDLAWIYAEQNIHLDRALELADRALALDPDNYAFLDTKAEVLYKLGRVDEAVAIAETLVREYSANAYSQQQLDKFKSGSKKKE
ncbi:MAG: CPBP family glutamic-type intramembrane protease [Candidatus Omnitrophota bacterium]|jgi:membrane protease YdiL (CAAX protease family)